MQEQQEHEQQGEENENFDDTQENMPEVDQELSEVATNPKKSMAIAVIIGLAFFYYMYVMFFQESEEERKKRAEKNIPVPINVVKPVQSAENSNIPSLPSLPTPPKLEDPTAPPLLIEEQAASLPEGVKTLPELPANAEALPTIALPESANAQGEPGAASGNAGDLPPPPSALGNLEIELPSKQDIVDPDEERRQKAKLKSSIMLVSGIRPQKTEEQLRQEANFKKRGDMTRTLGRGKIIPAVIETAINSDFGGEIRAVINRDIYSEWGRNILIPKGSRVFGNYSTSIGDGYGRVAIVWSRIDLVTGYSLSLDGTGIDNLGRKGNQGRVDNKFKERLANAVLRSALNISIASTLDNLIPLKSTDTSATTEATEIANAQTQATVVAGKTISATYLAQAQAAEMCVVIKGALTTTSSNAYKQIDSVCNTVAAKGATATAADVASIQSVLSNASTAASQKVVDNSIETRTETAANESAEDIAETLRNFVEEQDHSPTITIDQGTLVKIYVNQDYTFPKSAIGKGVRVLK